jgi:hypothetical protein
MVDYATGGEVSESEFPVKLVKVDEEDLRSAARLPGVVSIDDWLDRDDRRHRRTVVKVPGGFSYPQMNLGQADVERLTRRTAAIRQAVLAETEQELEAARKVVEAYFQSSTDR